MCCFLKLILEKIVLADWCWMYWFVLLFVLIMFINLGNFWFLRILMIVYVPWDCASKFVLWTGIPTQCKTLHCSNVTSESSHTKPHATWVRLCVTHLIPNMSVMILHQYQNQSLAVSYHNIQHALKCSHRWRVPI